MAARILAHGLEAVLQRAPRHKLAHDNEGLVADRTSAEKENKIGVAEMAAQEQLVVTHMSKSLRVKPDDRYFIDHIIVCYRRFRFLVQ